MMRVARREISPIPSPREIFAHLDKYVIGQDSAKRAVAIAAYNHFKRVLLPKRKKESLLKKSNMLLIGPTGCGKTHIARQLADFLHVPFTVVDATEYTEAGYYGKDVEVMVGELLFRTGGDVEAVQRGIIFVDEVDKIARRDHGARTGAGARDIGGEGVQQALLKLLEGSEVFVPLNVTQHWNKHDFVLVNTKDILFICAGTFTDLQRGPGNRPIGYGQAKSGGKSASTVTTEDLQRYGMIAEFLGRLPIVIELKELNSDELFKVLTLPPDSLANEYRELLSLDDIDLRFTDGALREIVAESARRKLGARGLRSIMEQVMAPTMFDAPTLRGKRITITKRDVTSHLEA